MSGNRVEELEAEIRKLQATIEGLTDELVETKERLGAIEDETGMEPDVIESRLASTRSTDESSATETDSDEEASADREADEEDATDAGGDDIIVA